MKILLTGGNGMVGRNILSVAEPHGFVFDAPTKEKLDLLDAKAVIEYIKSSNPNVVIHAAGLVGGIQANIASPYDFAFVNLQIGLNVINACNTCNVTRMINLGSSCMYPHSAQNPLKESYLLSGSLEPTNEGYAIAKLATAKLAEYSNQQHGTQFKTIIPCNLYGRWDKFDPSNSHMIPGVIRKLHEAMLNGLEQVDIWGDGKARREFMYADDLADFIAFVIHHYNDVPDVINAGLGFDYSINDYYQAISDVVGYKGAFYHDLSKPTGMKQKLVDTSLQTTLGWKPKHSLSEGLEKTYEYFRKEVL